MSARDVILAEIRKANGGATTLEAANEAWPLIEREYVVSKDGNDTLRLFEDRLRDYDAQVEHCSPATLTNAILSALSTLSVKRLAISRGLAGVDLPAIARSGMQLIAGDDASATELDEAEAVLTGATLGIAETGSIVLQNVPGQGKRALSLVPDIHLCVVAQDSVVETVPEAIRALEATAGFPTTFISGPSATADIEMTRIKGVHGPRFLHVFLAG